MIPGKSIINILPAISTEGMTRADLDQLMKRTHDVMSTTFINLTEEIIQATADKKNN